MSIEQNICTTLIQLLLSKPPRLTTVALAADVIAADARFNLWVALEAKRILSSTDVLDRIEGYEEFTMRCCKEVEVFLSGGDAQSLENAMTEIFEALNRLRGAA